MMNNCFTTNLQVELCRFLYKLHFQQLLLLESYTKLLQLLSGAAGTSGVADLSGRVAGARVLSAGRTARAEGRCGAECGTSLTRGAGGWERGLARRDWRSGAAAAAAPPPLAQSARTGREDGPAGGSGALPAAWRAGRWAGVWRAGGRGRGRGPAPGSSVLSLKPGPPLGPQYAWWRQHGDPSGSRLSSLLYLSPSPSHGTGIRTDSS